MRNMERIHIASEPTERDILVLGALGNNSMTRLRFALARLATERRVGNVVFVDIKKISNAVRCIPGLLPGGVTYVRIPPFYWLPMESLGGLGLDNKRLYTLISTPTPYHVPYALQTARYSQKVIVEKPLSCRAEEIRQLMESGCQNCYSADHYLHKAPVRYAVRVLRQSGDKKEVLEAAVLEFDLLEETLVGSRDIENAIWDLFWHFGSCMILLTRPTGYTPRFIITHVSTARYREANGSAPGAFTAARIEGYLDIGGNFIRFHARVGKGTDRNLKQLIIRYKDGRTIAPIPLDQTGWRAHYEMIRMFLTEETPRHSLDLGDALTVAGMCHEACAKAREDEEQSYDVGTLPAILRGGMVSSHGEGRIAKWAQPLTPAPPILAPA